MKKNKTLIIASIITALTFSFVFIATIVPVLTSKENGRGNQTAETPNSQPEKPGTENNQQPPVKPETPKPPQPEKPNEIVFSNNLNLVASENDVNLTYDFNKNLLKDSNNKTLESNFSRALKNAYIAIENYVSKIIGALKYVDGNKLNKSLILDGATKFNIKYLINRDLTIKRINLINLNNYDLNTKVGAGLEFNGFQVILMDSKEPTKNYTISFKNQLVIDSSNFSFVSSLIDQNFNFTRKWNSFLEWTNYSNGDLSSDLLDLPTFLNNNIASIEPEVLPKEPTVDMLNNMNELYVQKTIYNIMAKNTADDIKSSGQWYPGKDFDKNSFGGVNSGYINGDLIGRWGQNPLMMGWYKYTGIMNLAGHGSNYSNKDNYDGKNNELHKPGSVLNIFNISGQFQRDFLKGTPFQNNFHKFKLDSSTKNLVLGSVYNQETIDKLQKNSMYNNIDMDASFLAPTGVFGLMTINSYLTPSQKVGLCYTGQHWNTFGFNKTGQNDNTILSEQELALVKGRIETLVDDIFSLFDIFNLDLLDYDYEYPYMAQSHEKKEAYVYLVQRSRKRMNYLSIIKGKKITLSTAHTIRLSSTWTASSMTRIADECDYLNLMTYGMARPPRGTESLATGYNSKLYSITPEESDAIFKNTNPTVVLNNNTTESFTHQKTPETLSKHNTVANPPIQNKNWVAHSIQSAVDKLKAIGINTNKMVLGNASFVYTWDISKDPQGPLTDPNLKGSFTVGTKLPNSFGNAGIEKYLKNIYNKTTKVYFNPYTGSNHMITNGTEYATSDFVSSILAKRQFIKNNDLAGMMVWTINSQIVLRPNQQTGMYDMTEITDSKKFIKNFPILASSTTHYSNQELFDVLREYVAPNFTKYFLNNK